ncbi:DUF1684 domain-containing protein [Candidatus Villigracilis affinis]|uniref:DUF1684 domain-containing protein n=1 Tax=Candidatus Villigracilis affinis TaxID=3140682 RepID=UPI002A2314D0|nr:DUF1684 domain-containing protein [Anaerolineales bacterium]
MTSKTYRQTLNEWRQERDKTIRQENGWLSLAGLYWLKLGKNQFGSDLKCEVQLPARVPAVVGYLEYNGKSVSLRTIDGHKVYVNDKHTDFAILQPDISENPSFIKLEDVCLVVIQRGNRLGVRMWDNQREERRSFPARAWYDIDEQYRIPATFTPYERPKMAYFPDITGEKSEFPVEGYLSFEFGGNHYQLDINKEDDGTLFIRFWDPTSKDETYPTGRYLIADVEADGKIFIDFNRSYSPPCAFTDFATCVFAPEQNHLDFRVQAGELYNKL